MLHKLGTLLPFRDPGGESSVAPVYMPVVSRIGYFRPSLEREVLFGTGERHTNRLGLWKARGTFLPVVERYELEPFNHSQGKAFDLGHFLSEI